jgi:hypothetical protein
VKQVRGKVKATVLLPLRSSMERFMSGTLQWALVMMMWVTGEQKEAEVGAEARMAEMQPAAKVAEGVMG